MEVLEIRGTRDAMFTMRLNMANCFSCSVTWPEATEEGDRCSDDPQLYRAELVLYMTRRRGDGSGEKGKHPAGVPRL
ncbi:MAG: hypothetical protein ACLRTA_02445 [Clostridia bacterium]